VVFGILLLLIGGFAVLQGKHLYVSTVLLVGYQMSREFYTITTAKQVEGGLTEPSPLFRFITTTLSVGITVATYLSSGKSGMALAVSSLLLLALHIVVYKMPKFSHMATAVFGLFYCGEWPSSSYDAVTCCACIRML
jgi:phosphatidate cytidylyltransferase